MCNLFYRKDPGDDIKFAESLKTAIYTSVYFNTEQLNINHGG